ncbi:hypothetical protein SDC9_88455 [bioreactor metagenome]|uniref:Uncharacterized protein n=1 Tax=bioreactor metagenome TaxID=1076179 RepID=A0A644ZLZ0_9ZZZZ
MFLENLPVELNRLADPLLCHEYVRALADELQCVAVPRDEQRVDSLRLTFFRKGAQDIVRLIARRFTDGDAHLLQQLLKHGKLRAQIFLRLPAPRLVRLKLLVTKGGTMHIERDNQIVRIALDKLEEHTDKPVQRACRHAGARRHRRQRVICAVHQAVTVNCDELFQAAPPF